MPTAIRTRTVYKVAWKDTYKVSQTDGWQYMPDDIETLEKAQAHAELAAMKYPGVRFGVFRVIVRLEQEYEH